MKFRHVLMASAMFSLSVPVHAQSALPDGQTVPEAIYAKTEARFAEEHRQLYGQGDKTSAPPVPLPSSFMFKPLDVNADGKTDWLVDTYRGRHGLAGFCGTGGCLQQLYVSRPDGSHVLALSAQTLGLDVRKRQGAPPLVVLSVHGLRCGGTGSEDCRIGMQWSARAEALVPVASASTTAAISWFNPFEMSPLQPPAAISEKWVADGKTCAAAGMVLAPDVARSSAYPVADLNDDGVIDWFAGAYCDEPERGEDEPDASSADAAPAEPPRLSSAVFLSRQGGFAEALKVPGKFLLFLSEARPVLVVEDEENDCHSGMGSNCAAVNYVWNAAAGALQAFAGKPLTAAETRLLEELDTVVLADRWPLAVPGDLLAKARSLAAALAESRPPNDLDLARARFALGALLADRADKPAAETALRLAADALLTLGADHAARLARARVLLARVIDAPERIAERSDMAASAFHALEPGPQTAWLRNRAAELLIPALYRTSTFTVTAQDLAMLASSGAGQGPESWGDPADFLRYSAGLARQEFRWDDAIALDRTIAAGSGAEPADHAHLAFDLVTLARFDEAEGMARKAASLAAQVSGPDHPRTLRARSDLGEILLRAGKVDEAESLLQGVVARMDALAKTNHDLPLALRRLADCTLVLGRVAEAEPLLERALLAEMDLADQFILSDDYDDFAATRTLARVQVLTGKGHKAARALAQALQLAPKKTPDTLQLLLDYLEFADNYAAADDRSAAAYFAEADDESSAAIAAGAVSMARALFTEPHPAIARALALRAKLLARGGASDDSVDEAFQEAIEHARQLPGDAASDGLAVRVAWAEHLLAKPAHRQLALDITQEAVTIARNQRAALRGAGGIIVDPAIRRTFMLRASALLANAARATPAQQDEAFRTLQDAEVSLSAAAVAHAALGRSARSAQERALVAAFDAARRDARNLDKLLHDAVSRGDGQTVTRLIGAARQAREGEASAEQAVRKAFPAYARLADQPLVSLAAARAALPTGAALLILSADDQDVIGLLLTQQGLAANIRTGQAGDTARKLAMAQCTLDPRYCTAEANAALAAKLAAAGWEPDDPRSAFDLGAAHELYRSLLEPLLAKLPQGTLLMSVQQGWLASLPLAALPLNQPAGADPLDPAGMKTVQWLADRHPVAMLPFAGILAQDAPAGPGPGSGSGATTPFFGIGSPVLAGKPGTSRGLGNLVARQGSGWQVSPARLRALAPLPATRAELEAMAAALGVPAAASLRLGEDAREGQLRSDGRLAQADVIAIATHGLMPSQLEGLQEPGLVMTPPATPSEDDDGLWTASEVSLQHTTASLVVLSACNTASSEGTPGADALSGLARAFFLSGARALLASRWSVPDAPTGSLTVEMLSGMAKGKLDQARALQAAMQAVRTGKRADGTALPGWTAAWAHPASWAAFAIYSSRLAH